MNWIPVKNIKSTYYQKVIKPWIPASDTEFPKKAGINNHKSRVAQFSAIFFVLSIFRRYVLPFFIVEIPLDEILDDVQKQ